MTTRLAAGAFWLLLAIAAIGATSILSPAGILAYTGLAVYAGILWVRAASKAQMRQIEERHEGGHSWGIACHQPGERCDRQHNPRRIA